MMQETPSILHNGRFRRILRFFGGVILHVIWWDLLVGRIPLLGGRVRRTRPLRSQRLARQFRTLAIEMGGVMIKLGQFLSSRVDVLPVEITAELQGLQDEVPPVDTTLIMATMRAELGDLSQHFAHVDETPIAAASLGQAYRAWLLPENGESERGQAVVVKVQRPSIENIVQTDLSALKIVAQWLMRYRPIGKRADVPSLMEEFAATLWEELDYEAEAANAERFAKIHADDECIHIPTVYHEHSTGRILTLEDVTAIKVDDIEALKAAHLDPAEVANCLLEAYFKQFFTEEFFHADPHPGNLFVRPLGEDADWENGQEGGEDEDGKRPFKLIFVDFGMIGRVPSLVGTNLRKVLISITRRDARQLTEAYHDLGFFLPGADLDRIADAQATVMNRIWGRKLLELTQPDPKEMQELGEEFRDILFDFPFQIPQDFIYLGRALGMISGLVSQLDPEINPWYQIEKYGQALIRQRGAEQLRELSFETVLDALRPYLDVPPRIQRLLEMAENGHLRLQQKSDPLAIRRQERLERRIGQLSWSILGAAGIVAGTLWRINKEDGEREIGS